jgi:MFS family permease
VRLSAPLRQRDFRLLWTGMAVSLLGDGIFLVAVAWQAYAIADRPSSLAYVGIATALPQVAALPVAGVVADRFSRRTVLLIADVARACALVALTMIVLNNQASLVALCAVGAVLGIGTAFASPAMDALVPQLVPRDQLIQANVIDQFMRPATIQLAGPALGGVAVAAFGSSGAFCFDAATFAVSALCTSRMQCAGVVAPTMRANIRSEVADGFRYVRRHSWLWATFVSAAFTYLLIIGPTQVLLPFIVRNSLHQSAFTYGLVLAAGGVGALIGALFAARRSGSRRPIAFIYGSWTLATIAVAGYGIATNAWALAETAVVMNGAEAAGTVLWATLKQRRVDNAMLGRVSSIDWGVSTALLPASYALTAPIAHLLGPRPTLVLAGELGAAVTLGFLLLPGLRNDKEPRLAPRSEVMASYRDVLPPELARGRTAT